MRLLNNNEVIEDEDLSEMLSFHSNPINRDLR